MTKPINIYFDINGEKAYNDQGSQITANNPPKISYREKAKYTVNYITKPPVLNSDGTITVTQYTGFPSSTSSGTVDNNYVKEQDANVNGTITAGSNATVTLKNVLSEPRIAGTLNLDNGSNNEDVNFNGFTDDGSNVYTFTLADANFVAGAQTLSYSYSADDDATVYEQPIIEANNISNAGYATGVYTGELNADNVVYNDVLGTSSSISSCIFEHNVYQSGVPITTFRITFECNGRIHRLNTNPSSPSADYSATDSRYVKRDLDADYSLKSTLSGTELAYIDDGGTAKHTTTQDIADLAGSTTDSQVTITGSATTNINIGASATYRAVYMLLTIQDGTNYNFINAMVVHDGTNASVTTSRVNEPARLTDVSFTADISGGNLRLNVVNANVSNYTCRYSIEKQLTVTT